MSEQPKTVIVVDDDEVELPLAAPAVENLRSVLEGDDSAMLSVHDAAGAYLYASRASQTVLGRDPSELVGRSAYEFFHEEDLVTIEASHRRILETPDTSDISYRIERSDGSYHEVQTISWTVRDSSGEQTGIVAVTRPTGSG